MATAVKTRKCNNCGKQFPLSKGVLLLRGITFSCRPCYTKFQKNQSQSKAKSCEFC